MRTRTNIVQAIYNNAIRAQQIQSMGRPFLVVMTKTDHDTLHKSARLDIEKIAQAAGDKILDTHAGSGACLRAAYRTGHNFLGFEIDKDYFTEADKRLREEMAQIRFDFLFGGVCGNIGKGGAP